MYALYVLLVAPSSPPESVTVISTTSSSTTLSWSPPPADEQNGVIRYYVVYITPTNGGGGTTQVQANSTVFTIQNLVPFYSPYNISIAAYTVEVGPSSPIVSVTLPESGNYVTLSENLASHSRGIFS